MKFKSLKINGFGKLKNKEIQLSNGINIIYGKNEAGKSSLLKFISSMLYGASKNKAGKDVSDFDRYKPWFSDEFSGKIEYILDNGESFEVYRDFKKKTPEIYNAMHEDISKRFNLDKTKGIDFFQEQIGVDEETFHNTGISEQEGLKLSKSSQNSIVQKISNMISSGDDNISYKKTMEKISKKQLEEIGTERSSQRPINNIETKIRKLLEQKRDLDLFKENIYDNSLEKANLYKELRQIEAKLEFLNELKEELNNKRVKEAEIRANRDLEKDYNRKIEEINAKITDNQEDKANDKLNLKKYIVIPAICILVCVILLFVTSYNLLSLLTLLPILICIYFRQNEINQYKLNEIDRRQDKDKLVSELEILKEGMISQKNEADSKQKELDEGYMLTKENILDIYNDNIEESYLKEFLDESYDSITREYELKQKRVDTIKFRLHSIEATDESINQKLENLSKIEEEIEALEEDKESLLSLNNSYNIAKECLESAYKQVKENISPRFISNLCDIVSKISDGRYNKVSINDNEGIVVETEDGRYIPASRLSTGTIDQMYIAMRLSALNEITDEQLPIILDEAFAYFDDERLTNVLRYLNTNFAYNQIIIFTCSKREESILNRLGIPFLLTEI